MPETVAVVEGAVVVPLATGSAAGTTPVGHTSWRYQGRLDVSPAGLATPLYDMSARFYAPGLGAFTQVDSVMGSAQNPLSMNRFLYAEANPATMVDPTGHLAIVEDGIVIRESSLYSKSRAKQAKNRHTSFIKQKRLSRHGSRTLATMRSEARFHTRSGEGRSGFARDQWTPMSEADWNRLGTGQDAYALSQAENARGWLEDNANTFAVLNSPAALWTVQRGVAAEDWESYASGGAPTIESYIDGETALAYSQSGGATVTGVLLGGVPAAAYAGGLTDSQYATQGGAETRRGPANIEQPGLPPTTVARNRLGQDYPEITNPGTGLPIPYPGENLQRVPKENRVHWGGQERYAFIKEWRDRGLEVPEGGWAAYDIHHILPREYGGTNDFSNLVPVLREVHQTVLNPWWERY